ncbi:TonB-dependent receptor [Edaphobacter modestus]|uniref:Carboxypeptidase family protein n=1 Tax=Edaphobacter modestus TaxID=388466 RepID=A0A4Q7YR19_9BACT|nr:TonB-dependent receptor [Edaphobacter modestus]RZU40222.1 carboxypeptidase family protein [Edaphobacter modestus]
MSVATRIKLLSVVFFLVILSTSTQAQAVYGSIYGTVTDATGAVVPNAAVTVTDTAKGTTSVVQTNASGEFTADHLIPDIYDVKVTAPGFQGFQQSGIQVFADTSVKVQINLTVGSSDQTIEVTADSVPLLKTDRADISTVFNSREVQNLPLVGRNFTGLQLLLPGAQELGWSHAASENPQGSKQIMVDGQAFAGVAYELDGTDNQDPILGIIVVNPNLDSLSETKITTQNFDAEFGKAVSSVVTAQTKSGSNKFHGSAFNYRQSAANLARNPFTQGPTQGKIPQALRNQFGGSIGGPIIKDKLFFFGDYQGVRQKVGTSQTQTVPSSLLVQTCLGKQVGPSGIPGCDFSEYAANVTPAGAGVIYQQNGQPYPGNVIPASQVSPQARNFFAMLEPYAPNNPGTFNGLRNNYSGGGTGGLNSDQWDVRGDFQMNEKVHFFGRFSRFTDTLSGGTMFGAAGGAGFGLGGYGGTSKGANDSLALGTDIVLNPKLVTDIRLGYFRYNIITSKYDQDVPLANDLGIPGMNLGTPATGGAPSFQLAEVGTTTGPQPANPQSQGPQYGAGLNVNRCNCPLTQREDQYQIVNNWTKILGTHSIKVGADLRYARNLRVPSDNDRTGILFFSNQPTSNPLITTGPQGGIGFATFALGQVTGFQRFVSTSTNAKEFQKRYFFYMQDTWRATDKLTLNYGLRYEFYFPETINAPANGALLDMNTGYLNVAGVGGVASNMNWGRNTNTYSPRIGVAYQIRPTTVLRAGYGRSFDIGVFGSIFGHAATQNLPVLSSQQVVATGGPLSQAFTLASGPPAPVPIAVPSNGLLPNPGYAVNSRARPNPLRLPTLDAWNLSLQQSLTPTLSLTIAYVGNKGTHTMGDNSANTVNPMEAAINLPAEYSITGQPLHYDSSVSSSTNYGVRALNGQPVVGIAPNGGTNNSIYLQRYYGGKLAACSAPGYQTNDPLISNGQCGWTNGITDYSNNFDTHYNALQVSLAKQFARGFSLNANYAWQRATSWAPGFSTWDKNAVKGRDSALRQQQIIIYGFFQLPFGRNKPLFGQVNPVVNQIIGGWEVIPVINYSSGLPFTLSYGSCSTSIPSSAPCYVNGNPGAFRPQISGSPGHNLTYFKAQTLGGTFTAPGPGQIGNIGRNSVFGPNFFNSDMAIQKNFSVKEMATLQFRMDAFNVFNHINYGLPTGNIEQDGIISAGPGVDGTTNPRQLQFSFRVQF